MGTSGRYVTGIGFLRRMWREDPPTAGQKAAVAVAAVLGAVFGALGVRSGGARDWAFIWQAAIAYAGGLLILLGLLSVPAVQRWIWGRES
jgi:hypothetical protein